MITITRIIIGTRRRRAKRRLPLTTAATKIKTRAKKREAAATPIRRSCSPPGPHQVSDRSSGSDTNKEIVFLPDG
jgi:hypothetical protein